MLISYLYGHHLVLIIPFLLLLIVTRVNQLKPSAVPLLVLFALLVLPLFEDLPLLHGEPLFTLERALLKLDGLFPLELLLFGDGQVEE